MAFLKSLSKKIAIPILVEPTIEVHDIEQSEDEERGFIFESEYGLDDLADRIRYISDVDVSGDYKIPGYGILCDSNDVANDTSSWIFRDANMVMQHYNTL
jgi:hypothetical protein